MTVQIFIIASPWEPLLIKYSKIHWVLCWVCLCFAGILCSYTHEWVVPSTEIKYTRATVTESHFEKSVLVSKHNFSISWSVCRWVTKDCLSCVHSNICTSQGRMLRGSRWLLWSHWGSSLSALGSLLLFTVHLKVCQDFWRPRRRLTELQQMFAQCNSDWPRCSQQKVV